MVSVAFNYQDGRIKTIDAPVGQSLMEAAVRQGIDGIDADCGGALSCATCHVWIAAPWAGKLPERRKQEIDMLEFAVDVRDASRLCCQIILSPTLDRLEVGIPPSQK